MKTYEYKEIIAPENSLYDMVKSINEYGAQGWRCITWVIHDSGGQSALLERERLEAQ